MQFRSPPDIVVENVSSPSLKAVQRQHNIHYLGESGHRECKPWREFSKTCEKSVFTKGAEEGCRIWHQKQVHFGRKNGSLACKGQVFLPFPIQ